MLGQKRTRTKYLFSAPPQENYDLVQRRLDEIEEQLFPHIQRMLKRLYPELLKMIPDSVQKSIGGLEEKADEFDDDEDELKDFMPEETKKRDNILSQALILGQNLGKSYMFHDLRIKKGVNEEQFNSAFDENGAFSTGFRALLKYSRMSYKSAALTLHEDARLYIKAAMEKGIVYKDVAEGLKEVLGWEDGWRAMRIVRTEANWAANQGIQVAGEYLGVKNTTVNLSPGACSKCIAQVSERIFPIKQIQDILPVHPNCRCTAHPTIPDDWDIDDYL